jgi:hypothetical protein
MSAAASPGTLESVPLLREALGLREKWLGRRLGGSKTPVLQLLNLARQRACY